MTFDEVGAPACLSGGPSPVTNIPVVHTLLMAIQSTFDLEPEEPRKRYEWKGYSDHPRPKIVQIGPVVQALEQFSRMQSECEQTLVICRFTSHLVLIMFREPMWLLINHTSR